MKTRICLLFTAALALLFIFAGCASGPGGRGAYDVSGNVVIYTSMYPEVIESLRETMAREFPGCAITFAYGGTGQIQARIAAEEAAGRLGCDMLMVADPSYSIELKEKSMLHAYIAPSAGALAFDYDREGYWYPVRVSNMVLAYNPERTAGDTIPNSFRDFAFNAEVRGALSMSNPLTSGTTMAAVTALRDKYGYEYFDALGAQGVTIESGAAALAKLESGEYREVMVLEESVLQRQEEDGSKLAVLYPEDGTIIIPSTIMTVAEAWSASRNIRAAEAITEWFLSEDGQNAVVDGWMHSVRKDFPRLPYGAVSTPAIQANSMPVNWENCLRERDEIQDRFEEYVTAR